MNSLSWKLCLTAGVSCWMLLGQTRPVLAAEDNPGGPDERMQRLERRINEIAQRQDQMMGRLGPAPEGQGFRPGPGPENMRPAMPWGAVDSPMSVRIHRLGDMMRLVLLGCLVCNILLAIWIFTDIRQRGEGPGIFVALALVAGIPAAIIYSLVRISDKCAVTGKPGSPAG